MASQDPITRRLRLAELLAPLSLVTDLGMGAPDEQAVRACLLATGLARRMGLPEDIVADIYYTALIRHLGCTATAHEEASHLGGDELAARPFISRADFGRPAEVLSVMTTVGRGRDPIARAQVVAGMIGGFRWGPPVQRAICEVAALMAARLGMSDTVQESVGQTFERWDGKGEPRGLAGEAIAVPARFAQIASRAVAFCDDYGAEAALESVRASSGGWFDPEMASAFIEHGGALLAEIAACDAMSAVLDAEPAPRKTAGEATVHAVASAFADMADLKSLFTLGHSTGVERLVAGAAARFGLDEPGTASLRLAALLHDLGRVGVPAGTWDKAGKLTAADWERIRLHPYYTERILSRSPALAGIAAVAGMHHERADGSGYYRGARGRDIPVAARLLAAADSYQTKTEPRPHRPALAPDQAASLLLEETRAGRLDPDAVTALLEAAGARSTRLPRALPAGLTEREVEVLRLVATGCSNREVAERLVISRRTAEHHVQHIYDKIGLSTRAGAVMFALQHDLITPSSA